MAEAGLEGEVDIVIGTLGKALGSYGAYVCADTSMVRFLINSARSLIFSTAPPPPAVAGALAALDLVERQPERVERVGENAIVLAQALAREGLHAPASGTAILPLVVGDAAAAMRLCEAAIERGVFAQAIRPPTVAAGTSRLRLAVMASHSPSELRQAAHALGAAARECGLDLVRNGAATPPAAGAAARAVAA